MHRLFIHLLAASSLAIVGCRLSSMAVPPSLSQNGDRYEVDGPGVLGTSDVAFGPYRATDIHHGWIDAQTARSWGWTDTSDTQSSQEYSFRVQVPNGTSDVHCRAASMESATKFGDVTSTTSSARLECSAAAPAGAPGVSGLLSMTIGGNGRMQIDGAVIDVVATHATNEGSDLMDPTGYQLAVAGNAIGAIQTINSKVVWVARGLPPQQSGAVAIASAALVLFQDPRQHH